MGSYDLTTTRRYYEKNGKYRFKLLKCPDVLLKLDRISGDKWELYDCNPRKNHLIPAKSGVYAIVVRDTIKNVSDFAYVGQSENLNGRLYSHNTLRFLLCKLNLNFDIDLYLLFTDKHKSIEGKVISECRPFLNSEFNKRVIVRFSKDDLR